MQPTTGKIFVDDVGSKTWEEIDPLLPGRNYGWSKAEGFATAGTPADLGPGIYTDPILAYNHHGGPAGGGNAIIGGAFYDPADGATDAFPTAYVGKYLYADFGHDYIRVFDPKHPGRLAYPDTSALFAADAAANPTALTLAADGSVYYLSEGDGSGELLDISYAPTRSA